MRESTLGWIIRPGDVLHPGQFGELQCWGVSSEYDLKITIPMGSGNLIVMA